jgi:predicted Mrr-cat superfamily restriction endonuclease
MKMLMPAQGVIWRKGGAGMKRLWLVRLGRHGEQKAHALDTGELVLGFPVGDLRDAKDRDAVLKIVEQTMPGKPKTQLNFAAQLNQFSNTIQKGDHPRLRPRSRSRKKNSNQWRKCRRI